MMRDAWQRLIGEKPRLTMLAGALAGLAITLHLRRYVGINHDAVVYLGQALLRISPDVYGRDLFFIHGGSQDQYTLFPWMVAQLLQWLPPASVFLWGELFALLLFSAASWYCLSGLLAPGRRFWAWLAISSLPTVYGKIAMFAYSEQFLTPRPIAEALCLLGVGLAVRRHCWLALVALAGAAAFHPLQTLAACFVLWPWAVMHDKRWLHAAWLALPALGLAMAGVTPFAGIFKQIDGDWLWILRDNNPQLFVAGWDAQDLRTLALDVLVLGYGWHALKGAFGRWCAAALTGLLVGLAISLLLVDYLHLVLPAQLQLWRVHWLAHWLSMATIGVLMFEDWRTRDVPRMLVLALCAVLAWNTMSWSWPLLALLYWVWPKLNAPRYARVKRIIGWLCGLSLLILFADYAFGEYISFRQAHFRLNLYAVDRRLLVFPFLSFGLAVGGYCIWHEARASRTRTLLLILAAGAVVVGGLRWDLRPPQVLALEQAAFRANLFGIPIPRNAQVLWGYDMPIGPWLGLGRASYFSAHQLSGQVFNRAMAMDGRARLNRVYPLIREYRECQLRGEPDGCRISAQALRQACTPGGVQPPEYVVLPYEQAQQAAGIWEIQDPETGGRMERYYLYRCPDLLR